MSEKGEPREPLWTKEEDNFIREHSYMTVKELAEVLHRTEAAVRGRKNKLGVKRGNCPPFSDKELELIKEYYSNDNGVDLVKLSKIMNRPKTSISAKAKEMGLTKYGNFTKEERNQRGEQFRNTRKIIEHPRGMLGKHHTDKSKQKMSIAGKERASNMSYEEKHKIAMKAVETKRKNGTLNNTTSNAYSRTKSGKRKDLNNQFFFFFWEANVARILNHLNIEWEYEIKRFVFESDNELGVDSYQPDFYLPKLNIWIEVKGWLDEKSKIRLKLFREYYPEEYDNLIFIDQSFYNLLRYIYFNLEYWEDYANYTRPYKNNYFEKLNEQQKYFIKKVFLIKD